VMEWNIPKPKCRSPEASNMMWNDDVTGGNVDLS
jgi:hypothetical protein